ncbi:MAG: lipopolysaccharide biosynthesis protein [Nitrospira sp.]|nr:MAG: lipopolysaccharide biosynthesis protein [Nitrospira sp.]
MGHKSEGPVGHGWIHGLGKELNPLWMREVWPGDEGWENLNNIIMRGVESLVQVGGYRNALVRGLTSGLLAQAVGFCLSLWTVGISVRILGGSYGAWLAGFALISLIGMIEFGLGPFLVRETAGLRARSDSAQELPVLFSTLLGAYLVVATVALFLGWLMAPWIAQLIKGHTSADSDDLVSALRWGAVQVAAAQPLGIWRSLVHGSQKLGTLGLLAMVESAIIAIFTTILLFAWPSVVVIPLSMIIATIVSATVAYGCTPGEIRRAVWSPRMPDRRIISKMMSYCRPWIGSKVCFVIRERTDEPVAARFLGPEAVVIYTVTQRVVRSVPLMLLGNLSSLGFAPLSAVLSSGDKGRVRQAILELIPWLILFSVGSAALVWAVNPALVGVWVGAPYYGGDILTLVFSSWIVLEVLSRGLGVVLYAAGEQTTIVRSQAIEALLNLSLTIILVIPLGLVGIALGTTIASLLSTAWAIPRAAFRYLEIKWHHIGEILCGGFWAKVALVAGGIVIGRMIAVDAHWILRVVVPCATGSLLTIALFQHQLGSLLKGTTVHGADSLSSHAR